MLVYCYSGTENLLYGKNWNRHVSHKWKDEINRPSRSTDKEWVSFFLGSWVMNRSAGQTNRVEPWSGSRAICLFRATIHSPIRTCRIFSRVFTLNTPGTFSILLVYISTYFEFKLFWKGPVCMKVFCLILDKHFSVFVIVCIINNISIVSCPIDYTTFALSGKVERS